MYIELLNFVKPLFKSQSTSRGGLNQENGMTAVCRLPYSVTKLTTLSFGDFWKRGFSYTLPTLV